MYICPHIKHQFSCQILVKIEISQEFLNRFSKNIKFHENTSSVSRVFPCVWTDGQTDMTKLIVAFRNIANAFKKSFFGFYEISYISILDSVHPRAGKYDMKVVEAERIFCRLLQRFMSIKSALVYLNMPQAA